MPAQQAVMFDGPAGSLEDILHLPPESPRGPRPNRGVGQSPTYAYE